MPKKLYAHQERFLKKNPDKALLVWETGTGKTLAACRWIKARPGRMALVICPKAIVGKWERDLADEGVKNADVVSMSQLKNVNLFKYNMLVIDEAQHFASPLFAAGRSQRTEAIYEFIKLTKGDMPVLLLTATPIRSTPYNIHTLGALVGHYWPIKAFRDVFFYFTDMYGTWHWERKKGWQKNIRPYVEEIADIVLMQDCADVPPQSDHAIEIPWTKEQEAEFQLTKYEDVAKEWHNRHRIENGTAKNDKIMEIADGYRKVIVVCHYTKQIEDLVKHIGEERQVFVLQGSTKDQDRVIQEAREADDCIFIIQASMGAGFDASEFSVIIFASMSFKFTDMVQMKGRVKRINNLHANDFYFLIGGKCDKAVYETIKAGEDFDPVSYLSKTKR